MSIKLPTPIKLSSKASKFLAHFRDTVFTYIPDHGDRPIHTAETLDFAKQELGYGVFFSVNGFREGRRITENIEYLNSFFVDIDYPDKLDRKPENVRMYKNDFMQELFTGEIPEPSAIVETKNGLHIYWLLKKPVIIKDLSEEQKIAVLERYRDIEEALVKRFEGDPGAKDVCRVLRVPETLHQKDPSDPFQVKLIHYNSEMTYEFKEIRTAFLVKEPPNRWATVASENAINDEVKTKIEEAWPKLERPSYKAMLDRTAKIVPGTRNKSLLIIATACKESGWSLPQTLEHFGNNFYGLGMREIRRTIRSAFENPYEFGYNNEVMNSIVEAPERNRLSQVTSKILAKDSKEVRDQNNEQQKKLFMTYEHIIAERYPNLKYKQRGDFYDYKNGVYVPLSVQEVQGIFLREMQGDGLMNYRKVSSVNDKIACFKSIESRVFNQEDENSNPNIINFKNGLLNLEDYSMNDHSPNYLSTVQIPIEYRANAGAPQWSKFVTEIANNDMEQVKLLQQIAGYALTADTQYSKAFIFYGYGANGKSLFSRVLMKLVGNENSSSVKLSTLNKQFGLAGIIGKRLNIIDEISGNYFESDIVKAIVSGERLSADIKYRPDPIEFVPTVKIIFSVNELPKINDTTPGLYRRFIIIPFERTFVDKMDTALESKLMTELPGILNWALLGLKMLRQEGKFNETEKNLKAMRNFKAENSPLVEFVNNEYDPITNEAEMEKFPIRMQDFYKKYRDYCFETGYKPKSLANFAREINHSRVDGYNMFATEVDRVKFIMGIKPRYAFGRNQIIYDKPSTDY